MDTIGHAALISVGMIFSGDPSLYSALRTSLAVSLTATVLACALGVPLGALLSMRDFRGRRVVLVAVNALLGLPPVVIGLALYLLLSRAGPLGSWGLLFTTKAMVLAQFLLALPIIVALAHRATETSWKEFGDALRIDGASVVRCIGFLLRLESAALATTFLAAFGRAIAEVGAIMIVGGNIRDDTRTLTTAIVLETSKGNMPVALGLGIVLVAVTLVVSGIAISLQSRLARR